MRIRSLRVVNYKSYEDSGKIELSNGFNFVVGANNAGKTAFLEAFRLNRLGRKSHRSPASIPGYGESRPTFVDVEVEFNNKELLDLFSLRGNISIPFERITGDDRADAISTYDRLLSAPTVTYALRGNAEHTEMHVERWPSHGLYRDQGNRLSMQFARNEDGQLLPAGVNSADSMPQIISELAMRKAYVFNAQRFEVSKYQTQDTSILLPNASNLPGVLSVLRRNNAKFERFSSLVRQIFPSIKSITIAPTDNQLEIFIYNTDTDRPDLAQNLGDSGTGISQVMAILYVAMTIDGGLIVIDEPASFLHPSASRKLMQILSLFPDNQYVLSTHSSEIITAASADQVLLIEMSDGRSNIRSLRLDQVDHVRAMLNEIGASLSDVFGLDAICWVEGQTEQECFPIILREVCRASPIGISFRAMRHTSDFEKKRGDPREAWEIYAQISAGTALVPPAVSFNFDRDQRSSTVIADMIRQSKGRAKFLARETFENYLLHPRAITALLEREAGRPPKLSTVRKALRTAMKSHVSRKGVRAEVGCHGPKVLKELWDRYVKTHPYNKMQHSIELTRWIIANDPRHFRELSDYVRSLVPEANLRTLA